MTSFEEDFRLRTISRLRSTFLLPQKRASPCQYHRRRPTYLYSAIVLPAVQSSNIIPAMGDARDGFGGWRSTGDRATALSMLSASTRAVHADDPLNHGD